MYNFSRQRHQPNLARYCTHRNLFDNVTQSEICVTSKMLGSVQITHQILSQLEITDICQSLQSSTIKLLSLRECEVSNSGYDELMHSLSSCKSILQFNLNLGVVNSTERSQGLAGALYKNRSLTSLFIHGSDVGKKGFQVLCKALAVHPNIVSLDIGDCGVNDKHIDWIIKLLRPNGAKRGLQDLMLSCNKDITLSGWVKFFMALAAENCLKTLCLDYNTLKDEGVDLLCVALGACKHLETLDLEGTGITNKGATVLLHLLKSYPVSLTDIVLDENPIKKSTKDAIWKCLRLKSASTDVKVQPYFDSVSSTYFSDSGTETETNDSNSQIFSVEQSISETVESEYETDDTYSELQEREFETKVAKVPPRLTPQFMASATLKAKQIESESLESSGNGESDSGSGCDGISPRPRPYNGYFSHAMRSTGTGTMESPLHTVNSMQYAYSDISAS